MKNKQENIFKKISIRLSIAYTLYNTRGGRDVHISDFQKDFNYGNYKTELFPQG